MQFFPWFITTLLAAILCGCSTSKALLHLPPEQRAGLRLAPCPDCKPEVRFESLGAASARQYGGYGGLVGVLIGHSVAQGIEQNNDVLREMRKANGEFESALVQEQFESMLTRHGLTTVSTNGTTLYVRLVACGLREIERQRFAPFAAAQAELRNGAGKQIWSAHTVSVCPNGRPLEELAKDPALYRREFGPIAEDLAHQLIEGPIRPVQR